jgi:hypothetical protein
MVVAERVAGASQGLLEQRLALGLAATMEQREGQIVLTIDPLESF